MPIIKKTTRFTKEIKKPDEFITTALAIGKFLKEHKRQFLLVVALLLFSSALYLGINFYRNYTLNADSLTLSKTINEYQEFRNGRGNLDINQIKSRLQRIMEGHKGSIIGIRAGVLLAKIYEDSSDFANAGKTLKDIADRWKEGKDLKPYLLLNAASDFSRAGEYDKALEIYNSLMQTTETPQKEFLYLRKAETLKMAGRDGELNEFIKFTAPGIQDEIIKLRLQQLINTAKGSKTRN